MGPSHSLDATLESIFETAKFPKVQLERALGPILHRFIGPLVKKILNASTVVVLAPEFPLKTDDSYQSFNIDWMLYLPDEKRLVLVELKTSASSYSPAQLVQYQKQQKTIQEHSAVGLKNFVDAVAVRSTSTEKYAHLQQQLHATGWEQAHTSTLIYLAPGPNQGVPECPAAAVGSCWKSFDSLPESLDDDALQADWRILLGRLKTIPHADRGPQSATDRENYAGRVSYADVVALAQAAPDSTVVGFTGGINALRKAVAGDRGYITQRLYKYDRVPAWGSHAAKGTKVWGNWITGRDFLATVHASPAWAVRDRAVEALRQALQQAGDAWLRAQSETGVLEDGPLSMSLTFSPAGLCGVELQPVPAEEEEEESER